jgi:hypothetical protein
MSEVPGFDPARRETWMPRPPGVDEARRKRKTNGKAHSTDDTKQPDDNPCPGLSTMLQASTWLSRKMPAIDRLLGDLITTTTRMFLVGPTGLGKTTLGLACAMGIGFGIGFLHWRSSRPGRVLLIDGEMPAELLIQRLRDAARRIGREDLIDNIMVFSTEDAEEIAESWPMLGMFAPLNTEEGQNFIKRLVAATKPDVIIFDNVQAILVGVQKDEETWIPTLPLVQWLTKKRIGQLWIDHTNKDGLQYGSSTKSWRADTVGLMTPLDDDQCAPGEMAFILKFTKARRRTPDNWDEFMPHIIRLREDLWSSEPVEKRGAGGSNLGKVPRARLPFYDALVAAIGRHGIGGAVALSAWEAEALHRGLIDPPPADKETWRQRDVRYRDFRKAKSDLLGARWIAVAGNSVSDLKGRWE